MRFKRRKEATITLYLKKFGYCPVKIIDTHLYCEEIFSDTFYILLVSKNKAKRF